MGVIKLRMGRSTGCESSSNASGIESSVFRNQKHDRSRLQRTGKGKCRDARRDSTPNNTRNNFGKIADHFFTFMAKKNITVYGQPHARRSTRT